MATRIGRRALNVNVTLMVVRIVRVRHHVNASSAIWARFAIDALSDITDFRIVHRAIVIKRVVWTGIVIKRRDSACAARATQENGVTSAIVDITL